jgi:hypothetical protein
MKGKVGKKGQVVLKFKLSKTGRSSLAAAAYQLPVVIETTVSERNGTVRQTTVAAMLIGKPKK